MIFTGFLIVILVGVFVVVYNTSQESDCCGAGISKEQKVFFLIKYGENETGVAEQLSDGSYRLQDGTAISRGDAEVVESYEDQEGYYCCPMDPVCGTDGNTYMSICAAALANVQIAYAGVCGECECEPCDECVEPEPELRFVCANGQIVVNRIDCGGDEDCAYVVGMHYICPDQSVVDDPSECDVPTQTAVAAYVPADIQTVYECSDGREVSSAADCSANCGPVGTATAYVPDNQGYGGAVDTVYECWDGSIVATPSDCPLYCDDPCDCGNEYDPVCVNGQTYRNPCYAECDGFEDYEEGECRQPCAELGGRCTPIGSTTTPLTHVAGIGQSEYPTCCEQGTYCDPDGYCVPDVDQCEEVGGRCTKDEDCCEELVCGPNNICESEEECHDEGEICGYYGYVTGAAMAETFLGECCEGLICIDNVCTEEEQECAEEYYNCVRDEDCCGDMYCSDYGQCRMPCVEFEGECNSTHRCCDGLFCLDGMCLEETCADEQEFCRMPEDTEYGPQYDCCEGYVCVDNVCVEEDEEEQQGELCSGATEGPEWDNPESCATGYYEGVWGTYCGYCGDDREYRYYCVVEYGYEPTGAPTETLTDEVALSFIDCARGCSGTMCK